MSVSDELAPDVSQPPAEQELTALATQAARNLATTTKTIPQMQGITSRWLLRQLPWVNVPGGTYRVNRRLKVRLGRGRVVFVRDGDQVRIVPQTLDALPTLRGFEDAELLTELASRFTSRDFEVGETIVTEGEPVTQVYIVAHGKLAKHTRGEYGGANRVAMLADGDQLGEEAVGEAEPRWPYGVTAATAGTIMALDWAEFIRLYDSSPALREHLDSYRESRERPANRKGEAEIKLAAGHQGEPALDPTFVDYELAPREYELSITQTVLRVHSRVADLYNGPHNQLEQQLRLTVEEIRERQEWELLNNREFGLLHNTDYDQRISTWSGPPTPDDVDDLIAMRRGTRMLLAHPKAIAAFLRECNRRGLVPHSTTVGGNEVMAWRGVPIFPSGHIPIGPAATSTIVAMRLGEDNQGVVGLHQTPLPEEYQPSLNVRFMGIDDKAIMRYLVTAYYSVAILVPDACGLLENVEIAAGRS